jgi:hypothetical protein
MSTVKDNFGRLETLEGFGVVETWQEMRKSLERDQLEGGGAGTAAPAGQALTHATRHVRQETRVLPLDPAYCLVVFRICDCSPFCFPLHGFPD